MTMMHTDCSISIAKVQRCTRLRQIDCVKLVVYSQGHCATIVAFSKTQCPIGGSECLLRLQEYFLFDSCVQSRAVCVRTFPHIPIYTPQLPEHRYLSRAGLKRHSSQCSTSTPSNPFQWVSAAGHAPAERKKQNKTRQAQTPSLMSEGYSHLQSHDKVGTRMLQKGRIMAPLLEEIENKH